MEIKHLFILLIAMLTVSCSDTIRSEVSSFLPSAESSATESISESATLMKDDKGFYILPESSYSTPLSSDGKSRISYAEKNEDYPESPNIRLYQEGKRIPVYSVKTNASQTWDPQASSRVDNSVCLIRKNGPITLTLTGNFSFLHGVTIRPLSSKVPFVIDENLRLITFTIEQSGQYTFEFRLNRTLHLFVDDWEKAQTGENENILYFGPGIHNRMNDSRINGNNELHLQSNQTLFLDDGAIFQGSVCANNANHIRIIGGGIIDGSTFERNATTGTRHIPVDLNDCSDVEINGISVLDPAGWALNIYFNRQVSIIGVKIISSRSNGDGISLQSCQDVTVENCFVRSWDDSLVVKNYPRWSNREIQGSTKNILFRNCLIWTDLAQSMEIGYETVGEILEDVTFENITVLHNFHKPVFSIHNGNNAKIQRITYKNIVVEDASMGKGDGTRTLVDLSTLYSSTWSEVQAKTALGSISSVTFENIRILGGISSPSISILGCRDQREGYGNTLHEINDVTFRNFYLYGNRLTETDPNIHINEYVHGLKFM